MLMSIDDLERTMKSIPESRTRVLCREVLRKLKNLEKEKN